MSAEDELAARRLSKRRDALLRCTSFEFRLQWRPHWEFEMRLTGRLWFLLSWLFIAGGVGVIGVSVAQIVANWISHRDGDWPLLVLSVAVAALASWRTVALLARIGRLADHERGGPGGAA